LGVVSTNLSLEHTRRLTGEGYSKTETFGATFVIPSFKIVSAGLTHAAGVPTRVQFAAAL